MLDTKALAEMTASVVRSHVDKTMAPILDRLAAAEAREPQKGDAGKDGRDGVDGKDADPAAIIATAITPAVEKALGELQREFERRDQVRDAEHRAFMAEQREKMADMLRSIEKRLEEVRDGVDGAAGADGLAGKDGVDGRDGVDGQNGKDGADGLNGKDGVDGRDGVPGADGRDGVDGQNGKDGADGPNGKDGVDGQNGADGADGKDGMDGVNGKDAYAGTALGLFDPEGEYRSMDVVSLNGSEWRAKRDNPGLLPGDGWMLSAGRGKRGEKGDRGDVGRDGKAGGSIVAAYVDPRSLELVLTRDDGEELKADLSDVIQAAA